jgi:hypothetical protein
VTTLQIYSSEHVEQRSSDDRDSNARTPPRPLPSLVSRSHISSINIPRQIGNSRPAETHCFSNLSKLLSSSDSSPCTPFSHIFSPSPQQERASRGTAIVARWHSSPSSNQDGERGDELSSPRPGPRTPLRLSAARVAGSLLASPHPSTPDRTSPRATRQFQNLLTAQEHGTCLHLLDLSISASQSIARPAISSPCDNASVFIVTRQGRTRQYHERALPRA